MTISQQEYAQRRRALMAKMEPNSIAIIPSATEKVRSRDTHFYFKQDNDFFYLSGFNEPESVLVLIPGREHGEYVLFCRDKDKDKEIWDGYRAGPQGACRDYLADDAFPIDDIDEILPGLMESRSRVYYAMGSNMHFDQQVMTWVNSIREKVRSGATPPGEFVDLNHLVHEMRLFKSPAEVDVMRRAAVISSNAHMAAMQAAKTAHYEYQLEATINHYCQQHGARFQAYNAIVGGGDNACILHYVENNQPLNNQDLVLIDAGCELDGYASDITRTFPVGGVFSPEQAALYDVVLKAQKAAIEQVRPGNHWNASHEVSVEIITQGLVDLGLLQGDTHTLIEQGAYKEFYMHKIGHWIGLDVHDVGDYKVNGQWRLLETGMVMTVEPGIYVSPTNMHVDEKWRGIGIRIEDDILVTQDGHDILTKDVIKERAEIETLMAS